MNITRNFLENSLCINLITRNFLENSQGINPLCIIDINVLKIDIYVSKIYIYVSILYKFNLFYNPQKRFSRASLTLSRDSFEVVHSTNTLAITSRIDSGTI